MGLLFEKRLHGCVFFRRQIMRGTHDKTPMWSSGIVAFAAMLLAVAALTVENHEAVFALVAMLLVFAALAVEWVKKLLLFGLVDAVGCSTEEMKIAYVEETRGTIIRNQIRTEKRQEE